MTTFPADVISGNGICIPFNNRDIKECTTYKGLTKIFNLPVLSGIGESGGPQTVSEYCEARFARIVDNHLVGAIELHDNPTGYFQLGEFAVDLISGLVGVTEVRAYINDVFVENLFNDFVTWEVDDFASQPYLFVGTVETSDTGQSNFQSSLEFGDFVTRVSTSPVPNSNEIIVGQVLSGAGMVTVTKNVPNVKSFTDVQDHIFSYNPHGTTWYQDNITSSGVTIWGNREQSNYDLTVTSRIDVTSSGQYGLVTPGPGNYEFNSNFYVSSGQQVDGNSTFLNGVTTFVDTISGPKDTFAEFRAINNFDAFQVDSGLDVWGVSNVFSNWTFSDASNPLSGVGFVPLSGTDWGQKTSDGENYDFHDPSAHGAILDNHVFSAINPHQLVASGLNGVGILNQFGDTLCGHLFVQSGITIDTVDLSTLEKFIDGSVISTDHTHFLLQPIEFDVLSPPYEGAIISGTEPGFFGEEYSVSQDRTYYSWSSLAGDKTSVKIIVRNRVPVGAVALSGLTIASRVDGSSNSDTKVKIDLYDTENALVSTKTMRNLDTFLVDTVSGNGYQIFNEKNWFRTEIELMSDQNMEASVSDIVIKWKT